MGIFGSKFKNPTQKKDSPRLSLADETRIRQALGIRSLESMPTQAAQAFQMACNPKAQLDDFIKIVESDEVLSARIIRVANSVYYRRGDLAKDIKSAVTNIGMDELRCLLSAAMLKSLMKSRSQERNLIWGNSVATAIAARYLCTLTDIYDGEAFLCGILHDVGKLLFIQRIPKDYSKLLKQIYNTDKTFIDLENELLSVNHVEVGTLLSDKWNFPQSVSEAIAFHHEPWPKDAKNKGKNTSPAILIKCADLVAHAARLGHPQKNSNFARSAQEEITHVAEQLKTNVANIEQIKNQLILQFTEEYSLYSDE